VREAMNIRQRMLAVLRNQTSDRIPAAIYNRYHRVGQVEREARNNGLGVLHFEPVVSLMAPPWHLHPGYVSEVKGATFRIDLSWENGEQVETRTYETPLGTISQCIAKDPVFGSDWINKHYIKSIADYKVMQYIVENTVFKTRQAEIRQKLSDLGDDGVVLGRVDRLPYQKLLLELAGPERMFIDLARDPKPVVELLEAMSFVQEQQFSLAIGSEIDVIWQPDNITADMTPPKNYEKYLLPSYERRGRACSAAGKVYAVHMDGKLAAIKSQIARSLFGVVESFSFGEMGGDMTIAEALEAWPDKVICPNFPASLAERTRSEIEGYLNNVAASFGGRPYMLQLSEDIPLQAYPHILPVLSEYQAKPQR
jgi:hypothetical protein